MAKIGTVHIEIKPVLNEEALELIGKRIGDAAAAGVARGLAQDAEQLRRHNDDVPGVSEALMQALESGPRV